MLHDARAPSTVKVLELFLQQALGGMLFGFLVGWVTTALMRTIDSYQEEVLITLAAVVGGYALAEHLGISGPLAMVIAGFTVGYRRRIATSSLTRRRLDEFWELIDALLNSVLFVLMGFQIVLLHFDATLLQPTVLAILLVLAARVLTVALPVRLLPRLFRLPPASWITLSWGGVRGGISVALALSVPRGEGHDALVTLTYGVVIFSVLVQGVSIGWVVRRTLPCAPTVSAERA
jgi:CPA1 family monovalent cation:H+ antiporter